MKKQGLNRRVFLGGALAVSATMLNNRRVEGSNDRISIGIIGCGRRAQDSLLKDILLFREDTNVEVVAVCDTWKQMREAAAAQIGDSTGGKPQQFTRYQDLLALDNVDAVVIATPEHQHCTQLIAAVEAGKDAYVEKPLGMTMEEINRAYDVVTKHKAIVQNGTQIRSLPQALSARTFVTGGGLGRILKAEQSRNGKKPYWYDYASRQISASDVDWEGFLMMREKRPFDPKQYAGWYGYREFCLGPHTTQGLHFVDLVHYVTRVGCPRYATAHFSQVEYRDGFTVPDSIEMVLEYPEGWSLRYGQFFGNSGGRYLNIYGTRGTLDASDWSWDGIWPLEGRDSDSSDRIPNGSRLLDYPSTPHMKNWLECLRTREEPNAPIEAGYAHGVAGLLADLANSRGRKMMFDKEKREIREA